MNMFYSLRRIITVNNWEVKFAHRKLKHSRACNFTRTVLTVVPLRP